MLAMRPDGLDEICVFIEPWCSVVVDFATLPYDILCDQGAAVPEKYSCPFFWFSLSPFFKTNVLVAIGNVMEELRNFGAKLHLIEFIFFFIRTWIIQICGTKKHWIGRYSAQSSHAYIILTALLLSKVQCTLRRYANIKSFINERFSKFKKSKTHRNIPSFMYYLLHLLNPYFTQCNLII